MPEKYELLSKIADRAIALIEFYGDKGAFKKLDLVMDLETVMVNTPLRLNDLLNADNFNFVHDIVGIRRHLNRETGELEDGFSPRFTERKEKA